MNLEEILHDPRFRLPLVNAGKEDFLNFLADLFDAYIAELHRAPALLGAYPAQHMLTDDFIATARQISDDVLEILELRVAGSPDCWTKFEHFMERITWAMMIPQSYIANLPKGAEYFRCVQSRAAEPKSRFFHTPFHMREKVRHSRFSLDGVPSLYLANSLSSGYLECRAPGMDHFQAAKFKSNLDLKLLNLDYHLGLVTTPEDGFNHQRLGVLYPFYAACFTIYSDGSNFPEEYILSMMVASWVKHRGVFDGILYPSTKTASVNFNHRFINLVFPPKLSTRRGYCTYLKDKVFDMSEVCTWTKDQAEIEAYFTANYPASGAIINPDVITIEWPVGNGATPYDETNIGQMEYFMHHHDDMLTKTIDF